MKKLLIVNNNMHIGGIQKALLNLLNEIDDKYEVTLLLFAKTGALLDKIPKNVKVVSANSFIKIMGLTQAEARKDGTLTYLFRSFFTLLTRAFTTRLSFGILSRLYKVKGEYDCAVSYMQNGEARVFYGGCAEFVLRAVRAKKKVCFLHCNFLNYGGNTPYNRKILEKFDAVAAVSDSARKCAETADSKLPDKLFTVPNCVNDKEAERLSGAFMPKLDEKSVCLFTASRFSPEKGILRMLPIIRHILDSGLKAVWYVAGYGPQREEIERTIENLNLQNNVILLGNLTNPYPYFRHADIVLVPSYDEAAPMVFSEARCFGTPVFTTDTVSAKELILNTNSGWVCDNTDEAIERELKQVLSHFKPHKLPPYRKNNEKALRAFDEIIS